MEASIIAQEFQRFFSLFFSGKAFSCLLMSTNGEKIILNNAVAALQPEHKIWLSKVIFDENGFAILNENSHLHLKTKGPCRILRYTASSAVIYVIVTEDHLHGVQYLKILIPDVLRQLEHKLAASQLIARYQQRISLLESEKTNSLEAQKEALTTKIKIWKSRFTFNVEIDPSIIEHTENLNQQDELIDRLTSAVDLQQFLHPGITSLFITPQMLPEKHNQEPEMPKLSNWSRASVLLDKYEEAANIILQAGLTVNGKTIAQFLVPAISPPAITDALKKNRKGIHALLRENPGKWPLVRKNLKQVRELHENAGMFMD